MNSDPASINVAPAPAARSAIDHIIVPRMSDLGGVQVRRALPAQETQMIGPFIFFDEFGPAEFLLGEGLDIRPHPHIGLSTVTNMFEGQIMHRDSLGSAQVIAPGELNVMRSGRGIVHSERTPEQERKGRAKLYGIQTWMALPRAQEDGDPAFAHHGAADLPVLEDEGKKITLIMGSMYGLQAAAKPPTHTIYADAILSAGALLPFDAVAEERAFYVAKGEGGGRGSLCSGAPCDAAARRADHAAGVIGFSPYPARRRADGRAALHLVEFRLLAQGNDDRRRPRMGGRAHGPRAGRRGRVYPDEVSSRDPLPFAG